MVYKNPSIELSFLNETLGFVLKINSNSEAAYAMLCKMSKVVCFVWLWNISETPASWDSQLNEVELPANVSAYINDHWAFVPSVYVEDYSVKWIQSENYEEVALYLRGELIAVLSDQCEVGWSRMARDGPLAFSLIEEFGRPECEKLSLRFESRAWGARVLYVDGAKSAFTFLLVNDEVKYGVWLFNYAHHCAWKFDCKSSLDEDIELPELSIQYLHTNIRLVCPLQKSAVKVIWGTSALGKEARVFIYDRLVAILPLCLDRGYSLASVDCDMWMALSSHPDLEGTEFSEAIE